MTNYKYSAKNDVFIPASFIAEYEESGWDFSDAIDVDDDVYLEFINPPAGKVRVAGKDGLPAWVDIPPPTHEELVAGAEAEKQRRIGQANDYMHSRQWPGKAAIGRLKGDELAQYNLWLDYLDELEAVDVSTAPDVIWPEPPEA